jgi:hypothetical protein
VQPFAFIDQYFWLICIVVTGINYLFAIRVPPELANATSAQKSRRVALIQRGFAISALPWLVMGAGIVTQHANGVFSYFDPRSGNAYVWAWYVSLFLISCAFCYWVFAHKGAKEIVELKLLKAHGPTGEIPLRENWVKFFAAMGPPFVVLWVYLVSMVAVLK